MIANDDGFGVRYLETVSFVDSDAEHTKSPRTEGVPGVVEPGNMLGPETTRVLRAGESPTYKRGDVSTFFP